MAAKRSFDRPLMYALGTAWTHKEVRKLKATQLGAFVALSIAALEEDFEVFIAKSRQQEFYARATAKQWGAVKDQVIAALRLALPDMQLSYQTEVEAHNKRLRSQPDNLRKYREMKALQRKLAQIPASLADQSHGVNPLQPIKLAMLRPMNQDRIARTQALEAIKSNRLSDKSQFTLRDKN